MTDPKPPVASVIIPARNAAGGIGAQLEALSVQTFDRPWELLVVDNRSTDTTVEVVGRWQDRLPFLRLVDASAGAGVAYARNRGAAAARGELFLYCDADDEVEPDWVAAMVAAGAQHDVFGGRLSVARLNAPDVVRWRDPLQDERLPVGHRFLPYAVGANIGCRRAVHEAIGGWDEHFLTSGEDVDFCWRAQLAGFSLGFARDAVAQYRYRAGLSAFLHQRHGYGRSSVAVAARHGLPVPGTFPALGRLVRTVAAGPRHVGDPVGRARWAGRVAFAAGQVVEVRRRRS